MTRIRILTLLLIAGCNIGHSYAQFKKAKKAAENGHVEKSAKFLAKEKELSEYYMDFMLFLLENDRFSMDEDATIKLRFLNTFIDKKPDYFYAYHMRGRMYFVKNDFNKGIADFDRSISLNPGYCNSYAEKMLMEKSRDYKDSIDISKLYTAITCKFEKTDSLRLNGYYNFYKKDYLQAIRSFTAAIEFDSNYKDLNLMVGCCYNGLGRHEEALGYFDKQIRKTPSNPTCYNFIADCKLNLKDYPGGLKAAQAAMLVNPNFRRGNLMVGRVFQAMAQYDSALKYYNKVPELRGNYNNIVNVAYCHYMLERYDSALVYYTRSLPFAGDSLKKQGIFTSMGNCFKKLKLYGDAIENYRKSIAQNPAKKGAVLVEIADCYSQQKKYAAAGSAIKELMALDEKDMQKKSKLFFEAGSIYFNQNMYDSCIYILNKALTYHETGEINWKIGGSYFELKEYDKAIMYYKKTMPFFSIYKTSVGKLSRLIALSFERKGRYDSSAVWYTKCVALDSSSSSFNNLAWSYFNQNRLEDAGFYVNKSLEKNEFNKDALDTKGCILYKQNKPEEALKWFDKCLEIDAKYANSYLYKGKIHLDQKNNELACINLRKALEYGKEEAGKLLEAYCK